MAKQISWKKIRNEYVSGTISYKNLAAKHGIPLRTLEARAKKEKWVQQRKTYHGESMAKTIDALSTKEADRAAKLVSVADKLLAKIEKAVEDDDGLPTAKDIRSLTRALLDLKELQGIKSDADRQEQEARIAILQKQASSEDDNDNKIEIVLDAEAQEFSK